MEPFPLSTTRFVLDQPRATDVDRIAEYCTDTAFEKFMSTPWPYKREHADYFVRDFVPSGWSSGSEWTWAIREGAGQSLLGVVGVRLNSGMVGYWLGRPQWGRGIMTEALSAAIDAVFEQTERSEVLWECVKGNVGSLRVAQRVGFRFRGEALGIIKGRDGSAVSSWTGTLGRGDDRNPQSGWPTRSLNRQS
ncbi:GNAT family N-acetyltransferase [Agreia pratensis]|uniref:Protein N-acetyltransferase, RimJ/RimL family n=1 Tax=Agreia pratensis TaxID=150121 RepID=A0A1X7I7W4_9MICO|nr:GNAT family N-acetyltransferase [Agreia pratensis]SMG10246.1 Protein N-acetyltransferase, RimJ/RimL family [Agreia pratensis]